ncbi:MAG: hypothetical protein DCC67_01450 [Planctomycetota bacterium]|nr:MAG: hypothetical protein DCC67_01450 [Planctomycetota bacterium]
MHDSLIRKFCESRYRWAIVSTATALFALLVLLPLVDEFFDKRMSRTDLASRLETARRTAEQLPAFEKQVAGVREQLGAFEARTIDEAGLAGFRSRMVDAVRESGCQIRRFEVSPPAQRPWMDPDSPLAETQPNASAATPFLLERRNVVLAVDGAMSAVQELLARLEKEQCLSHPRRLNMQSVTGTGEAVTLEMELWLFALVRKSA